MSQNKDARISGESQLPGQPGYRTRGDRSGLDVLDTQAEAAHMEGVFYRSLFTLKARTRNPFYLILMFIFGVIPFPFIAYLIATMKFQPIADSTSIFDFWPIFFLLITAGITVNFALSMLTILNVIPTQKNTKTVVKQHIKKQPKRRKDFK